MTKKSKNLAVLSLCIAFIASLFLAMTFTSVHTTKAFAQTQNDLKISSLSYSEETASEETADYQEYMNYLGYAINVLTASSFNETIQGNLVLTSSGRQNLSKGYLLDPRSYCDSFSSVDVEEMIDEYKNTFSFGVNFTFIADLETKLTVGLEESERLYNYRMHYVFYEYRKKLECFIDDYNVPETYENAYSTYYLNDLALVASGDMSYESFFAKYGTHLIGEAYFGGKYFLNYIAMSNTMEMTYNTSVGLDVSLSADFFELIEAAITTGVNSELGSSFTENSFQKHWNVQGYGGPSVADMTVEGLYQQYQDWRDHFNANEGSWAMIDYPSDGLVALWDILPSEYSGLASDMEQAFESLVQQTEEEFIEDYQNENTTLFAGGVGSENKPYKVSTAIHLMNLNVSSPVAYYIQTEDIDLSSVSQWNAIGGHHKERAFKGHYDGNGKTIYNLTRTQDIVEQNSRIYFGLFGYIGSGAVVEDLYFDGVNIQMTGPAVNNSQTRVFVGVLAGMAESCSIKNIAICSGAISYNCNTNGVSQVGGVLGLAREVTAEFLTNLIPVYSKRYGGIAGGIAGYSYKSTFKGCMNNANVTAQGTGWGGHAFAGGIVGLIDSAEGAETTFIDCSNDGTLTASGYSSGIGGCEKKTGDDYAKELPKNFE